MVCPDNGQMDGLEADSVSCYDTLVTLVVFVTDTQCCFTF